ncbi:MAG: tetratricopeptide repeat protein, partial [Cyclobacteriaceae bacterium]|nr:tetratricopeptide repeat protein [Cyclobacteriaceae bacterium]
GALSDLLDWDDQYFEAWFKRGELYYRSGLYPQAIEDFTVLINHWGRFDTRTVFFQLDEGGAEQVKVSTLATMQGQVYGLRAMCYQAVLDYDKAAADFNESVRLDSTEDRLVNRALFYKEINETGLAIHDLRAVISMDSLHITAWFNLLLVNPQVTIPESIVSSAEFVPLLIYQGVEAFQNGQLAQAEALFAKALQQDATDPLLLINYGRLMHKKGRYEDAIFFFRQTLEKEPDRIEAYYLMGNSFYQSLEYKQAAAYYELYLARDRANGLVWFNAALAYRQLGDNEQSCTCIRKASGLGMVIDLSSPLWDVCKGR